MLVFHPKQQLLAVVRPDGVRVWDAAAGTATDRHFDPGIETQFASWSADGEKILAAGSVSEVYSFGIPGRRDEWTSMLRDRKDTNVLVPTCSKVCIWNVSNGSLIAEQKLEYSEITSTALSQSGKVAAIAFDDGRICLFDLVPAMDGGSAPYATGHMFAPKLVIEHSGNRIWSLAFSPDATHLAGGAGLFSPSDEAVLFVWDVSPGAFEKQLRFAVSNFDLDSAAVDPSFGLLIHRLNGHRFAINQLRFSENGRFLASGSMHESSFLWDLETGHVVSRSDGPTDPATLLIGLKERGYYLVGREIDLELRMKGSHEPQAWLHRRVPVSEGFLGVVDSTLRIWAINEEYHLGLYRIEMPP